MKKSQGPDGDFIEMKRSHGPNGDFIEMESYMDQTVI